MRNPMLVILFVLFNLVLLGVELLLLQSIVYFAWYSGVTSAGRTQALAAMEYRLLLLPVAGSLHLLFLGLSSRVYWPGGQGQRLQLLSMVATSVLLLATLLLAAVSLLDMAPDGRKRLAQDIALYQLGEIVGEGRTAEAREQALLLFAERPEIASNPGFFAMIGMAHHGEGRHDAALWFYEKALSVYFDQGAGGDVSLPDRLLWMAGLARNGHDLPGEDWPDAFRRQYLRQGAPNPAS